MADLIDCVTIMLLCKEIECIVCEIYNTGHMMQNCDYDAILNRVKRILNALTIEAEPIKRGEWKEIGGYEPENQGFVCSVCDFATTVKSRFCQNCGVCMINGGAK